MKKRLVSSILSLAMVAAMSIPTFAASSQPNFTVVPGTPYSAPVTGTASAEFQVGPADDSYYFVGYADEADAYGFVEGETAKGVTEIKYNFGKEKISNITVTPVAVKNHAGNDAYASLVKVTGKSGEYGPASIEAFNKDLTTAYVDLTVYVEDDTTRPAIEADSVNIVDVTGRRPATIISSENVSVAAAEAAGSENNPFRDSDGCAQSYPTAADSLFSVLGNKAKTDVVQSGGYVSSMTINNTKYEQNWSTGLGWNYCVFDKNMKAMPNYSILSASVFEATSDCNIYWAYGTYTQATDYFNSIAK